MKTFAVTVSINVEANTPQDAEHLVSEGLYQISEFSGVNVFDVEDIEPEEDED